MMALNFLHNFIFKPVMETVGSTFIFASFIGLLESCLPKQATHCFDNRFFILGGTGVGAVCATAISNVLVALYANSSPFPPNSLKDINNGNA